MRLNFGPRRAQRPRIRPWSVFPGRPPGAQILGFTSFSHAQIVGVSRLKTSYVSKKEALVRTYAHTQTRTHAPALPACLAPVAHQCSSACGAARRHLCAACVWHPLSPLCRCDRLPLYSCAPRHLILCLECVCVSVCVCVCVSVCECVSLSVCAYRHLRMCMCMCVCVCADARVLLT